MSILDAIGKAFLGRDPALPKGVQQVLDAAIFLPRSSGEVAVVLAGGGLRGAFFLDRETAKEKILKRFPELTKTQVLRAIAQLEAGAQLARREEGRIKKPNWVNRY